jgi:hypothetical protein
LAGGVGALGAFTLIAALGAGGPSSPIYVMPLVFGLAPVVSAFTSMYLNNTFSKISPFFAAGLILVAAGAVTTLLTAPKPAKKAAPDSHGANSAAAGPLAAVNPTESKGFTADSAEGQSSTGKADEAWSEPKEA